jgi:hypothetical protein
MNDRQESRGEKLTRLLTRLEMRNDELLSLASEMLEKASPGAERDEWEVRLNGLCEQIDDIKTAIEDMFK